MFYYSPPKSSVWGHLLRKMPASRARERFEQFIMIAVGEYELENARLSIVDPSGQLVSRYEHLIGAAANSGQFATLNKEQSELCLNEIIRTEALGLGTMTYLTLLQRFKITKWRIGEKDVATRSTIGMHYGLLPCLTTQLQFETIEQFENIKQALESVCLCKLNIKHLRSVKTKQQRQVN